MAIRVKLNEIIEGLEFQSDRTGTDSNKGVIQNLDYDNLRIKFSLWQDKLISMTLEAPK
jgi:hypothetical protein